MYLLNCNEYYFLKICKLLILLSIGQQYICSFIFDVQNRVKLFQHGESVQFISL